MIAIRVLCLLADGLDIVGAEIDELELHGAVEDLVEGEGNFETAGVDFRGVKLYSSVELLHTDRGDGQFLVEFLWKLVLDIIFSNFPSILDNWKLPYPRYSILSQDYNSW